MIKLGTPYSFGPIIESNFLGISNDAEPTNIIVTLSKNVVTGFHMPSKNQVHCWRGPDKLSTEVIYESLTDCYYGVFNNNIIGKRSRSSLTIKDKKKYHFSSKIMKLLTRLDYKEAVAVFENGHCEYLKGAISNRKKIRVAVINDDETIELAKLCLFKSKAVCIVVSVNNESTKILRSVPFEDTFSPINLQLSFKKSTYKLLGYCIMEKIDSLSILTFWSDGFLYCYELDSSYNDFPGKQLAEITLVDLRKQVTIIQLSSSCIGIYGAEPYADGAALIVYHLHFKVVTTKHFENYTDLPNLWCFGNHLLLVTDKNLAVIPFTCTQNHLSNLIDSIKTKWDYEEIDWDTFVKEKFIDKNNSTSTLSQSKLNKTMISEYIKNHKDESLIQLMEEVNDISDTSLVEILSYCSLNTIKHSKLLSKVFSYPPLKKSSCLRGQVTLENTKKILNILYSLLKETPQEERLVDWMHSIIEGSYQQLMISHDPQVPELINKVEEHINKSAKILHDSL